MHKLHGVPMLSQSGQSASAAAPCRKVRRGARTSGNPLPGRRPRQIHASRACSIATRSGTSKAGVGPSCLCSWSFTVGSRARQVASVRHQHRLPSPAGRILSRAPPLPQGRADWDLCGLTHPSSLVEWKRLKMMQIRGLPRSAASSAGSWSRAIELRRRGPKASSCGEIGAASASGRKDRQGEDGERVAAAGPRMEPEARKGPCTSAPWQRLRGGRAARGASPGALSQVVHGTGFAAASVGKRPTTAQSR